MKIYPRKAVNLSKQIHRIPTSQHKVRFHVLAIGLVLVGINSYWILMGSEVWHSTQLTIASLFFNAVFTLLVLSMVNFVLLRISPRLVMSQADLLTVYAMVVMVSTISGHTMMGYLLPAIEHVFWFASAENEWEQLFGSYTRSWFAIKDREVLRGFFQGESSLYSPVNLRTWLPPVIAWSGFVIALWMVLLSLSVLLRKQWTENEKLSYPIVIPKFFWSKLELLTHDNLLGEDDSLFKNFDLVDFFESVIRCIQLMIPHYLQKMLLKYIIKTVN